MTQCTQIVTVLDIAEFQIFLEDFDLREGDSEEVVFYLIEEVLFAERSATGGRTFWLRDPVRVPSWQVPDSR